MTINKFFKSVSIVLLLFLLGSVSLVSMDNNNNNNNNISYVDEKSDFSINEIKNEVDKRLNNLPNFKKNPVFFKMIIDQQEIYIIGSYHPIPPSILLSNPVLEKIISILPNCTLFTEHEAKNTYQDIFLELLNCQNKGCNNKWDIKELTLSLIEGSNTFDKKNKDIDLNTDMAKNWNSIKTKTINDNIKYELITKLDFLDACLFLHFNPNRNNSGIKGFESTLINLHKNNKEHEYLEEYKEYVSCIKDTKDNIFLKNIFSNGLIKILRKPTKMEISTTFFEKTHAYGLNYLQKKILNPSTKERNKLWAQKIFNYTEKNKPNNPILIICGASHLSELLDNNNKINIEGESFLSILLNGYIKNKKFKELFIIDYEGVEIKIEFNNIITHENLQKLKEEQTKKNWNIIAQNHKKSLQEYKQNEKKEKKNNKEKKNKEKKNKEKKNNK